MLQFRDLLFVVISVGSVRSLISLMTVHCGGLLRLRSGQSIQFRHGNVIELYYGNWVTIF